MPMGLRDKPSVIWETSRVKRIGLASHLTYVGAPTRAPSSVGLLLDVAALHTDVAAQRRIRLDAFDSS